MENKVFQELLQKYLAGLCSPEELVIIDNWLASVQQVDHTPLSDAEQLAAGQRMRERMLDMLDKDVAAQTSVRRMNFKWMAAAAILLLIAGAATVWFMNRPAAVNDARREASFKIMPGKEGAILTLSNGKQILLDSTSDGVVAHEENSTAMKSNGELVYTGVTDETPVYNTLTTPAGRTFAITLPDGTKVWLNASSSITYPISFPGKERRVSMTGEAYFEVKHDEQKPFYVVTEGQVTEDLGTSFNINAYADEDAVRTTLLEGGARVWKEDAKSATPATGKNLVLRPGEQAEQSKGELVLRKSVDTEAVIAWKNGKFQFNSADLPSILRQAARWYGVTIVYETQVPDTFTGGLPRSSDINELLHILEGTGKVRFAIQGQKIIVHPVK
ncbi:MAG: FecR domain-containing protein [Filimonas sp.]|nr:FecR domain-containing protein [Filimonas sp.]